MSDYFPREIWLEILHRQIPKSLVKCTSVCKEWKSLITDPSFISDHISRQTNYGNQHLLLLLCRKSGRKYAESFSLRLDAENLDLLYAFEYPFNDRFANRYPTVVGTCNGMVCLADCLERHGYTFILWNPSIRKYVVLPTPGITVSSHGGYKTCLGFGFDSKNNDFKVVKLVTRAHRQNGPPKVEVYSLARGSWKPIRGEVPLFYLRRIGYGTNQMFLNGVLHWVVKQRETHCNYILTFDVAEETFGELMLPNSLSESKAGNPLVSILEGEPGYSIVNVLGGGESLTVFHGSFPLFPKQCFSIWVMKEYGVVESWTKVFSYESDSGPQKNFSKPLGIRKSGEVVLQNQSRELLAADPESKKEKNLGIKVDCFASVDYHVEGLSLLDKKTDVLSY